MRKIINKINIFLIIATLVAFFITINICLASNPPDITIIEIAAFKTSGYEYIKLYNNTNDSINLEGWKFVEGFSESKINGVKHSLKEYNQGFIIPPNKEVVICQDPIKFSEENNFNGLILDSSWSSLNESGERLQLLDNDGKIIEDFTYISAKVNSLKRINFTLLDYTSNNWQEKTTYQTEQNNETPNSNNQKIDKNKVSKESHNIIFTEILPNPAGADNEKEFIEIKNISKNTISLNGWQLKDNSKRTFTIKTKSYSDSLLRPNHFFIFYRDETGIALNNSSGDELKIYNKTGSLIDKVSYKINAPEKSSYAKDKNNLWRWVKKQTPGEENNLEPLNEVPIIDVEMINQSKTNEEIYFDASDSYDPDNDEIFFIWNFGDNNSSTLINPNHSYAEAGEYKVTLAVFDSRDASTTKEYLLKILSDKTNNLNKLNNYPKIIISEIFPNPAGQDDDEFIELFNPNLFEVNLSGWTIKDASKSSKWEIENNITIDPQDYIVFTKDETGINLNNKSDSVYLIDPTENIIDKIFYSGAKEDMSYSLNKNKNWLWNNNITPWEENNFLKFSSFNDYTKYEIENIADPLIDLAEIKNLEPGTKVEAIGLVTAEPGILGKQIFYLNGLQIYMYNKDFPELSLGDKIKINGEVSKTNNETRIKIKDKENIEFLGRKEKPEIKETFIEDIDENLIGNLIKINGEVTEHKGNTLWIDDDTEELKIYINKYTGINLDKCEPGQFAEITGILSKTDSGYRLMPRYLEDIKLGKILGEKAYASESEILDNEERGLNKYIIVTALAILSLSVIIVLKNKRPRDKNTA
jgi:PKD repeat protein